MGQNLANPFLFFLVDALEEKFEGTVSAFVDGFLSDFFFGCLLD
jgi:hypothetical protein